MEHDNQSQSKDGGGDHMADKVLFTRSRHIIKYNLVYFCLNL